MYDIVFCNGDRCRWKDGDALQSLLNQYYSCAVARQGAKNDAILKSAVETNAKSITRNMEEIIKNKEELAATNRNLADLASNVTALTNTVNTLAATTEQGFIDVNNDLFNMGNTLALKLQENVVDLTDLIADTANSLSDDMIEISQNLTTLIDSNTNLINDVKNLVSTLDDATNSTFQLVQEQFEGQNDQIRDIVNILVENFYKESNRNRQIVDLYENIVDSERKMALRLEATKVIHDTVTIWENDESLSLFTLRTGELPYFQVGVDNEYIPIFTQVWKSGGLYRYYMFLCDGERLSSFASINIDISLLLSLFEDSKTHPICVITENSNQWIAGTVTVNQMIQKTRSFDTTLSYTEYIVRRKTYLSNQVYEIKTYSASDYGLQDLNAEIKFDRFLNTDDDSDKIFVLTDNVLDQDKFPQNLYENVLISLPFDEDLQFIWTRTASTLGLLATRRHYGYIGDDVSFDLRAGQSNEFGDIINCVDVSLVAVNQNKKTIYELSSPIIDFRPLDSNSNLWGMITVNGDPKLVPYENLEFISTTDLPETLRVIDDFTLGAQTNFNVYDIPYEMIKIAENPEARLGSVNYIMTNDATFEFARDVWEFEFNTFKFKPETHIGLQSFNTEYDINAKQCVTFNNGICAALEHFNVIELNNWSRWEPKSYRVKFQIRLNETLELVLKLEDGCPNIVGTDKLLVVENNNDFDIEYRVDINGVVGGQNFPILAQERDQFEICQSGETDIKVVEVTNPTTSCPTQKMTFNCSLAVHVEDRAQLISEIEGNIVQTVTSDFTSQLVTVSTELNGDITQVETTLAAATQLVQSNLDNTVVQIDGQIVDLNNAFQGIYVLKFI